jgi:hypothetical protein
MDALTFYAQQGALSKPGRFSNLYESLPVEIDALCKMVQGTTLHVFWAKRYGIELPVERQAEVQLRWMERRLQRMLELDPNPLNMARQLDKKLVGNCRDFSLMLASILRSQGVPARARCGFGAYFLPNHFEDHWVCEYWNAAQKRWILVDAQLDEFQCQQLHIGFDPLDVPRDQFIVGGQAWQMCRNGQADPNAFGIGDMHGLWFVRGDFIRDVAALNKMELLPWDCWGLMMSAEADSEPNLAFLDRVAEMTDFESLRNLYERDERLKVGGEIQSFVEGKMVTVDIPSK